MDGLLIAASHWYLDPEWWISIAKGVAGLGFVIFVHELGHFLAAKACGVKCEKFYVGFDVPIGFGKFKLPRSLVRFQWGETEYGIGILPLGGYVKMLGQDDDPRKAQSESDRTKVASDDGQTFALDPRSYPAKTVPQRMLIISAGVIMNLIFAVIFATIAYRQGVPYSPCEVGSVVAGSPAWNAGLQAGDRILQIGDRGRRSDHLRYDWDLVQGVGLNGAEQDLIFHVRRRTGEEKTIPVRPRIVTTNGHERPTIGVRQAASTRLSALHPTIEYLPAGKAGLEGGDEVIAVNGQPVKDYFELQEQLWRNVEKPLVLQVRRAVKDTAGAKPGDSSDAVKIVELTVEPNRRRTLGLVMQAGPIQAVQPDSPAQRAGIRAGDMIETLDGQPIGDPVTLPSRLSALFGKEVECVLKRPSGSGEFESVTVKLTPEPPPSSTTAEDPADRNLLGIDALGVTYAIASVVAAVVPDSPAAQQGIEPGDKITTVQFLASDDAKQATQKSIPSDVTKPLVMDESKEHWLWVEATLQLLPTDIPVRLTLERGQSTKTVDLTPVAGETYVPFRGLIFSVKSEKLVSDSWGEAIGLGFSQTREDARRVKDMVVQLIRGRVSPKNFGGPLSIGAIAASEASKGLPALLMFLTFLSANLAVLNFLPIPALDGGHIVFLLWEGLFRKPVNERVQIALTMAGVACLLALMIFVFGLDFWRFSRG